HDAEDVFQAVFLSLARLAKSIRQGRALPAWLHQTTCRVAAKLRARRLAPAAPPPQRYERGDPAAELVWREVRQALDEELQRVPATVVALMASSALLLHGVAMRAIAPLLAVIALGVGVYAGMGQTDPPKQADRKKDEAKPAQEAKVAQEDDPLPAGSVLRFGT